MKKFKLFKGIILLRRVVDNISLEYSLFSKSCRSNEIYKNFDLNHKNIRDTLYKKLGRQVEVRGWGLLTWNLKNLIKLIY